MDPENPGKDPENAGKCWKMLENPGKPRKAPQ
jgi:hypothetical protein